MDKVDDTAPRAPRSTPILTDPKLYLVAGKGGSGKSSVTAALALALARRGRRVLASSASDPTALARYLGGRPGPRPSPTAHSSVHLLAIDLLEALEDFGQLRLGSRRLVRALVRSRATRPFLDALPGVRGLALLGRLNYYTLEAGDTEPYDAVVLETSGMGHLPRILVQASRTAAILPRTVLRADLERLHQTLWDPQSTAIVMVAQPEHYSAEETLQLWQECVAIHRPPDLLVLNQVLPDWIEECEAEARATLGHLPGSLALLAARSRSNMRALAPLRRLPLPKVHLPALRAGLPPQEMAALLAERLLEELSSP